MSDRPRLFLRTVGPDDKIGKVVPIPEDVTDRRSWLIEQIGLFVEEVGVRPVQAAIVPAHEDSPQGGINGKEWVTFGS